VETVQPRRRPQRRIPKEQLEQPTGTYDSVVPIGLLMFLDRAVARCVMDEIERAVRPGGVCVLNVLDHRIEDFDAPEPGTIKRCATLIARRPAANRSVRAAGVDQVHDRAVGHACVLAEPDLAGAARRVACGAARRQ